MTPALLTAEPLATSTRHVVELRDVVARFGGKQVLDHVSLVVAPQERTAEWEAGEVEETFPSGL